MAKRKKKELSSEGKTELAKTIAEKSQTITRTYENIENVLGKFFRWMSNWLDKLLFNQKHGKLVALFLALLLYGMVNLSEGEGNLLDSGRTYQEINNVPVSVEVSDQLFEVDGLPETVNIKVFGLYSDLQGLSSSKYRIVADLSNFDVGTHEVTLKAEGFSSRLDVSIEPATRMVTMKKKIDKRFALGYEYVNLSSMDNIYELSKPELDKGEVIVRASEDTLSKISYVKALINVKGETEDFETDAEIVAYDENGDKVDVDIVPETMHAKVKVTKPEKEVPISILPHGIVPNGKAIESYTLDRPSVILYANNSVLDAINEVVINLPVNTLTGNMTIPMPIIYPTGVNKASETTVNISIKLADMEETRLEKIPILFENKSSEINFKLGEGTPSYTSVKIKGAKKVIEALTEDDVKVYVDFSEVKEAGSYELPLFVEGKNKLATYEAELGSIKVDAEKKS